MGDLLERRVPASAPRDLSVPNYLRETPGDLPASSDVSPRELFDRDSERHLASHGPGDPLPQLGAGGWQEAGIEFESCPTIFFCLLTTVSFDAAASFSGVTAKFDRRRMSLNVTAGRVKLSDKGMLGASMREPLTQLILDVGLPVFGTDKKTKRTTTAVPAPTISVGHGASFGGGLTTVDVSATVELGPFGLPQVTTVTSTILLIGSLGALSYGVKTTTVMKPNPTSLIIGGAAVVAAAVARTANSAAAYSFGGWLIGGREPGR